MADFPLIGVRMFWQGPILMDELNRIIEQCFGPIGGAVRLVSIEETATTSFAIELAFVDRPRQER